ncbi:MAG: class I SAM-dependent methyltransferase [Gammaproteobacteria bacterium]
MLLIPVMRRVIRYGTVSLIDASGNRHQISEFGKPEVVLRLTDNSIAKRLMFATSMGWCEAYMDGKLLVEEGTLGGFLEVWGRSEIILSNGWLGEISRIFYSVIAALDHYNPMGRARRNVAHHYDLSGELYDLFLDSDRQYSCAYFPQGDEDIETAQLLKKRHIAAKLDIKPGMTVLDIGSGWGGMAIYLAKTLDCQVLGVTLSEEQYKLSKERIKQAGLDRQIRIELRDYRTLSEQVDRIVSVGMLEHVGQYQYGQFFGKVRELLKPDGVALIHTIARMEKPQPVPAWIRKYIFPGGYLPTTSQLAQATERHSLWITDMENLRLHYSKTLSRWYERFSENRENIAKIFDERFCRMWEMYLLASEMAFRVQNITVLQLQITREVDALPITRDYMLETERALSLKDSPQVARSKKKSRSISEEELEAV